MLTNDTFKRRMEKIMISIHPTFAKQLYDYGYTRESFIKWLYDRNASEADGANLR